MKHIRPLIVGLCAVLLIPLLTGCKTAYRATSTVTMTVAAAENAWSDYAPTHATPEQRQQVIAAAEKYDTALHAAQAAVDQWFISQSTGAPFPQAAVAAVSAASADLVTLINQFMQPKGN